MGEALIKRLHSQLQQMGLQYTGTDINELKHLVLVETERRKDKPNCYLRSYDPTSRLCQRCDLWNKCVASVHMIVETNIPDLTECNFCDGDLVIPLSNSSGKIIDYSCSTRGCPQLLSRVNVKS